MRYVAIFIFLILSEVLLKAQSSYVESAITYANEGDYEKAVQQGTKGLKLIETSKGKNNMEYVNALYYLGLYYSQLEDEKKIKEITLEIENTSLDLKDEDNYDYIDILDEIADYYKSEFDYAHAASVRLKLINLMDDVGWKKDALDYFAILNKLFSDYIDAGNYEMAFKLGHEMEDNYRSKTYGSQLLLLSTLSNLAETYSYIGNYNEAIRLAKESLSLCPDTDMESKFILLNNLASYYDSSELTQEALLTQQEAVKIASQILPEYDEQYIASVLLLGRYLLHADNIKEAVPFIEKAKNLWESYNDPDTPYYAEILSTYGKLKQEQGNWSEAVKISEKVLGIYKSLLGESHPSYLLQLLDLMTLYRMLGMTNEYENILSSSYSLISNNTIKNFSYLSKRDRDVFWNNNAFWFKIIIPIITFESKTTKFIDISYNSTLFSKGILLNSEIEFDKFLAETGSPELAEKYDEIRRLRTRLNKLYDLPVAERGIDTDSLERMANNLERELMYESKEFGDYTRNLSITWQDVQKGLKDREAAIEFVSFELNQDSTMYIAYVLKPGMEAPEMVRLFEEKELTDLIPADDSDNDKSARDIYNDRAVGGLIWRKLTPQLEGCESVYFAPDGMLHQIAIEYLPDPEGEGLISDRYSICRLSSTRQLALNQSGTQSQKAAVFGGIDYDTDIKKMKEESDKYPKTREIPLFYNLSDSLGIRAGVAPLDRTGPEAEYVAGTLKEHGYVPSLILGEKAVEESFKALSGKGNAIIHIATHGFYCTQEEADESARYNQRLTFMSQSGETGARYVEDKALTRSGLMMAGVNNTFNRAPAEEGVDDGILTAQEISQLNLRGTDLVVLSACQTGLGEISGDGVFGLQRGFKKAGVNSLLMSLWPVNDVATEKLMQAFYRNLMEGRSKQEALRNAQKELRDSGFDNPEYWAAFILLDGLN